MKRKDHNNNLILELKILENRTGNIQTCKRLQKSGIKKRSRQQNHPVGLEEQTVTYTKQQKMHHKQKQP